MIGTGVSVTNDPSPAPGDYQRLRLRFRKERDLRWIGHRDLVRVVERLCRRAGLTLRMSEGFHPKPKLRFPSALALGIAGLSEVMELDLTTPVDPQQVQQQLNAHAPAGLVFTQVVEQAPGGRKARAATMRYQFSVPAERCDQVEQSIRQMMEATSLPVQRDDRSQPIDIRADLAAVALRDGLLSFTLRAADQASARPRDVLQMLGLADLEQHGQFLTRSEVEVVS